MAHILPSPSKKNPFKIFRSKTPQQTPELKSSSTKNDHGLRLLPDFPKQVFSSGNSSTMPIKQIDSNETLSVSMSKSQSLPSPIPEAERKISNLKLSSGFSSPLIRIECLVGAHMLQLRSEALLLNADIWPHPADRPMSSFNSYISSLFAALGKIREYLQKIENALSNGVKSKPNQLVDNIRGISSHTTALISISYESVLSLCPASTSDIIHIDRTQLLAASDQVDLVLFRISQHLQNNNDCIMSDNLTERSDLILRSCGDLSTALTGLVTQCRPSSQVQSEHLRLIQLAVSGVQTAAQCFLSGLSVWIRRVAHVSLTEDEKTVGQKLEADRQTVFVMSESVKAACQTLVTIALNPVFVGYSSSMPVSVKAVHSSICGSCLTVSSSCVQLFNSFERLTRLSNEGSNFVSIQKCFTCIQAVTDAISHFNNSLNILRSGHD